MEENFTEITPTNGQVKSKVYRYVVKTGDIIQRVSAFASCSTVARLGLTKLYPDSAISFDGASDTFVHIQG